ncbi:MAG TPA: WecB/TagA/CpsF family glycosyltransferase [Anaerolineaceae bacterium]|nr:WecB/TagA/CpsF family glycosyltransferase [Anaerolineaceae bacterium]HQH85064.1 WecB/TagA/CpsF family glycosyltransferase [Anaerolineaceae bacterium]
MKLPPRVNLLGVGVHPICMADALSAIQTWIASRQPHYICLTPAHAIMECVDHPELRPIYNHSGLTTPDGMAIVWLLRAAGHPTVERVYGPDLLAAACQAGLEPGWRHYFYGGAPGVPEQLSASLSARFPGLQVCGTCSPPFRPLTDTESQAMQAEIQSAHPDILWVGIGSPRQERWMSAWVNCLDVPVLVGVGAAFDFLSGIKPQAPRWIQRSGLEWLFRLFSEPSRLWRRYLLGYPRFVVLILLQALGLRRTPLEDPQNPDMM